MTSAGRALDRWVEFTSSYFTLVENLLNWGGVLGGIGFGVWAWRGLTDAWSETLNESDYLLFRIAAWAGVVVLSWIMLGIGGCVSWLATAIVGGTLFLFPVAPSTYIGLWIHEFRKAAHERLIEERSTPPIEKSTPKPKPTKTEPPNREREVKPQWDKLLTRLDQVAREIDLVSCSSATRNEFAVLKAAIIQEGNIIAAEGRWNNLQEVVNLSIPEIDALSPVDRSLKVFGLTRHEITGHTLKDRHRRLAKQHHPDTGPASEAGQMSVINEAYNVLKSYLVSC